jgi:rhodanese-related sulfurtransferase
MIKQITSIEVEEHIKNNPQSILLDVRTEEEWNMDGKPDGEKFGLQTYFLTIKDENFINDFKKLGIGKDIEILTMCMGGVRSQAVAELLIKEEYKCTNVSDGFLGNSASSGWKNSGLPCK